MQLVTNQPPRLAGLGLHMLQPYDPVVRNGPLGIIPPQYYDIRYKRVVTPLGLVETTGGKVVLSLLVGVVVGYVARPFMHPRLKKLTKRFRR